MAETPHYDIVHGDSLSPETRGERRNVLVTSGIVFIVVGGGLVPSEIQALGLSFGDIDQRGLLVALGAIVCYQILGFSVYAWNDWHRSHIAAAARGPGLIDRWRREADVIEKDLEGLSLPEHPTESQLDRARKVITRVEALHQGWSKDVATMELEHAVVDFADWRQWPRLTSVVARWGFDYFLPIPIAIAALWIIGRAL